MADDLFALFDDEPQRAPWEARTRVRRSDPATSKAAAIRVGYQISLIMQRVFNLFIRYGDMTDNELLDRYRADYGPCKECVPRKRRHDLIHKAKINIIDTGVRRDGQTVWGFRP